MLPQKKRAAVRTTVMTSDAGQDCPCHHNHCIGTGIGVMTRQHNSNPDSDPGQDPSSEC